MNETLNQKILHTEKAARVGSKVRMVRDGKEIKVGFITALTSIGAYLNTPKDRSGVGDPPRFRKTEIIS